VGTGALASDDLRVVSGEGASFADEGEAGAGGVAEVDDDDRVFGEFHVLFDGGSGVDEFGSAKIADEQRVLEAFPVLFHGLADLAEASRIADVVGDEKAASGHGYLVVKGM
jgi:hypothetical protein